MKVRIILSIVLLFSMSILCNGKINLDFLKSGNENGQHYAVLVAGSNGFWNYRHQSDIFHSYHLLVENGIPRENIIVLAYDDIANDRQNPIRGKVFNRPDPQGQGKDVYAGIQIDYRGDTVTPQNFLAVLEGNKKALSGVGTGRVLQSTENDNVFVYFSDHGATGLIAFPTDELYADKLNATLNKMHKEKRYNQLVFYLEACESGSMFNNILATNLKIYSTTAANPEQSSWATYCGPDDVVNGVHIGSCLGDEYSVNWMEDSDNNNDLTETLDQQYGNVKVSTKNSQVIQYGDLSFVDNQIGNYQGAPKSENLMRKAKKFIFSLVRNVKQYFGFTVKSKKSPTLSQDYLDYLKLAKESRTDSRQVKLRYLFERTQKMNDLETTQLYLNELTHISLADAVFDSFNEFFEVENSATVEQINFECLRPSVEAYKATCQWGEYDLKYVRNIAIACNKNHSLEEIKSAFEKICRGN